MELVNETLGEPVLELVAVAVLCEDGTCRLDDEILVVEGQVNALENDFLICAACILVHLE